MVGVDVDEQQKMEGYVRVTHSLFDASCDAIQNRILDKIQTHDFNNLTVSFSFICPALRGQLSANTGCADPASPHWWRGLEPRQWRGRPHVLHP